MQQKDIRQAITQAENNETNSTILFTEIILISIGYGLAEKSWYIFGGVFLGLIFILQIKVLSYLLLILLSIVWGAIGYGLGTIFGSTEAMVVLSILGFLLGLGVHFSALEGYEDLHE